MSVTLPQPQSFLFKVRPIPVPADLRISWRIALILLMLYYSRSKKSSLAKLHIINHAIRSQEARVVLSGIIANIEGLSNYQISVEPAFGRAIDFVVGEGFADWINISKGTGLELSAKGIIAAEAILGDQSLLKEEKEYINEVRKEFSEAFVIELLAAGRVK